MQTELACTTCALAAIGSVRVPPTQFRCLDAIARAYRPGGVPLSLAQLRAATGMATTTIVRAVRGMAAAGIVVLAHTPGGVTTYQLPVVDAAVKELSMAVEKQVRSATSEQAYLERSAPPALKGTRARVSGSGSCSVRKDPEVPVSEDARASKGDWTGTSLFSLSTQNTTHPQASTTDPQDPASSREAEIRSVSEVLDAFTTIRRARPAHMVERVLRAAEAWGRNGFEAAAALYRAHKLISHKRELAPREWEWCLAVVRNHFELEERGDAHMRREAERSEAAAQATVQPINEQRLPFDTRNLPPGEYTYDPDFTEQIRSQLRRAFAAKSVG